MSYPQLFDIARGLVQHGRPIRRFGINEAVGGSLAPVARGGVYRTLQSGAGVNLRIRAGGNAGDSAAGAGAREITIEGIDDDGLYVTETVATAGASASAATQTHFIRISRAYVSHSGTYATQTAPSHLGTINIEDTAGNLWAVIQDGEIPFGATDIAVYTVPRYQRFYLFDFIVETDPSNKCEVILYERRNILETAPPYSGMSILHVFPATSGFTQVILSAPIVVPELTDIGFMAMTRTGTITVSAKLNGVELRA